MTVLLVDSDLGFVFWLGQTLHRAGCEAFPAKSVSNAAELIEQEKVVVDVLVIDPAVPDAISLVSRLRSNPLSPKVIASVVGRPEEWSPLPGFDSIHQKPRRFTNAAALQWFAVIHRAAMNRPQAAERFSAGHAG